MADQKVTDPTAFWTEVLRQNDRAIEQRHQRERAERDARMANMIRIPKGTQPSRCRGVDCGGTIYWVERPRANGKPGTAKVPVSADCEGGSEPDSLQDGLGVLHFTNCPNANEF